METAQEIVRKAIAALDPPTQYRLHKVLHVSQATVSDWVHGKTHPNGRHLLKLMEIARSKQLTPARAASTGSNGDIHYATFVATIIPAFRALFPRLPPALYR